MQIRMRNAESLTHSQIGEFLKASEAIEFAGQTRAEVYAWVPKTLVAPEYGRQAKKTKGAIRAYLSKVTGLSLPQIARLIRSYGEFVGSKPSGVSIAERRRPEPHGQPGYWRVDTVHQGDWDGEKKCVAHQRSGHGDAMAGGGLRPQDRPTTPAGSGPASVPVSHPRVPCRQRLGIYQPPSGPITRENADRVHQVTGLPQPGQRIGGRQKRRGNPQTHGLRPHTPAACRAGAPVPHGASEPVFELPLALRFRYSHDGRTRQAAAEVQPHRLRHAKREAEITTGGKAVLEARFRLRPVRPVGQEHERHRVGSEDGRRQKQTAAILQNRIAVSAALPLRAASRKRGYGNDGAVESVESQKQASPSFHQPLGNLAQRRRDSHSPGEVVRKSGNPKPGFPLSPPTSRSQLRFCFL